MVAFLWGGTCRAPGVSILSWPRRTTPHRALDGFCTARDRLRAVLPAGGAGFLLFFCTFIPVLSCVSQGLACYSSMHVRCVPHACASRRAFTSPTDTCACLQQRLLTVSRYQHGWRVPHVLAAIAIKARAAFAAMSYLATFSNSLCILQAGAVCIW